MKIKLIIKFVKWFKRLFNVPTYYISCDPATKDGDYSCKVKSKYYPKTGIWEIKEIEYFDGRKIII